MGAGLETHALDAVKFGFWPKSFTCILKMPLPGICLLLLYCFISQAFVAHRPFWSVLFSCAASMSYTVSWPMIWRSAVLLGCVAVFPLRGLSGDFSFLPNSLA